MSSGFVSGGTDDKPVERDGEWLKAQQELEANRACKEREGLQEGNKSLYEILQSNKAAKQDAFEESIRLKNQFRQLDDEEVEFLDSVLESTRRKEAEVKKETAQHLESFRRLREEADKAALENERKDLDGARGDNSKGETWAVNRGKKRRDRDRNNDTDRDNTKVLRFRRTSSSTADTTSKPSKPSHNPPPSALPTHAKSASKPVNSENPKGTIPSSAVPEQAQPSAKLGLVSYSSEEDE